MIRYQIACLLRSKGKHSFVSNLPVRAKVLDVGCGNGSVLAFKEVNPSIFYVGVDVADYMQTDESKLAMDKYLIFDPSNFADGIDSLERDFDAVVWSHNIEHCNDRLSTMESILRRLKIGGRLYLSFPCEESVSFPSRKGTLNYFDDKTHLLNPPEFNGIINKLTENNFEVTFSVDRYKPWFLYFIGFLIEPISSFFSKIKIGTWEFWGFETIIHARKGAVSSISLDD
jgi:SAM-dependent methyltransferase